MKVRYKILDKGAVAPIYSSVGAAGADLVNYKEDCTIAPGKTVFIGTGIALEIPLGYVGLVFARSGLASKRGLAPANKVGVVDSDYRGEIKVALYNHSSEICNLAKGERIAQIVIVPCASCEFEEGDISNTARGEGGFGSTGK